MKGLVLKMWLFNAGNSFCWNRAEVEGALDLAVADLTYR